MAAFTYKGRSPQGELVRGRLDADTADEIAMRLIGAGITPIDIGPSSEQESSFKKLWLSLGGGKPKTVDLMMFSRQMYRASRAIAEQLGTMSTSIQEDLSGIAVIKHYTLEPEREAKFRLLNDEYLARSLTLVRSRGTLTPLFAMLGGAGTLIVLWAGGREVIAGRLSVGGLVAFNAYLVLLSWPTIALGWIIGIWQRGLAAWIRVRELLSTVPRIADPPDEVGVGVGTWVGSTCASRAEESEHASEELAHGGSAQEA